MFADLWCVARGADPNRTGYCDNTGYNGNKREFIFTVQFSYDLTHYDGGDQYNYLHLVYLSQYDNNGIWVGTPRDLNNGRPFRRMMPTPYERALDGIRLTASVFPAATFLIAVICLFFYRIDRPLEVRITDELAERRKSFALTPLPVSP